MITNDQIEAYLIETGVPFEQLKEGFWLIHNDDNDVDNIVLIKASSFGGNTFIIRSTVDAALLVCTVAITSMPISAAVMAR